MSRRLLSVIAVFAGVAGVQALAETPRPRPLESALAAASDKRWDTAETIAERAGPAAEAVVEFTRLYGRNGTPEEVVAFVKAHPDWPGLSDLRKRNEEVMADADLGQVLAFYRDYTAQTGMGALGHAGALNAHGKVEEAKAVLIAAWQTLDLSTEEHDQFVAQYNDILAPHHAKRLDMAIWRGLKDVTQMLPLVDEKTRALAKTRQTIENGGRVSADNLPEGGAKDPGIAYARFIRHIRDDRDQDAIDLIIERSAVEGGLGQPSRWASWRRFLARSQMRDGQPDLAYKIASTHQLTEGSSYADLEWLSGYLALIYLEQPELALDHFQRFRAAVASPISLGRAGYWLGRAQEAMGDAEAARISYTFGAQYQTSFYGLLAAEKAGLPFDVGLNAPAPETSWRDAAFADSTEFKAGVLLLNSGRLSQAERYFVSIAARLDEPDLHLLGAAMRDLGEPHLQVMVGKAAAKRGITVAAPYYALHPLTELDLPVAPELALAIARRESEFDKNVVSGAGAEGLMQLMPGTSSDVARDLGIAHDPKRVLSDAQYNARLGSAYLAQLIDRFDGNIIMVSAGYNAGPGRPIRWMERFGDPREKTDEIVNWIEHIPFRETRNYVMRVSESLPVYRARLGEAALPVPFTKELAGKTLSN